MRHETKGYIALTVLALLPVLGLLALALTARGQWGTSRGPVGPAVNRQVMLDSWKQHADGWAVDPADCCREIEWKAGRPVAVKFADGSIRAWDSHRGVWGAWRESAVIGQKEPEKNFGLGWTPDPERPEKCYLNGVEVDRRRAVEAISADVPDDSKLLRLTVIGSSEDCRQVQGAIDTAPELALFKGKMVVQCYQPDHWAVADSGFKRDGKPTIYVQAPGGKVLHRQDEWRGAAKMAEALRRADPSYDPKKDPDLNKQVVPPLPDLSWPDSLKKLPAWFWGILIAVAVLAVFYARERMVNHVR